MSTSIIPANNTSIVDAGELLKLALTQGAGIEVVERLMKIRSDLQEEYAKRAYYKSLSEFQAACPVIHKTKAVMNNERSGSGIRYHYAPLETIQRVIGPLLLTHGFSFRFEAQSEPTSVTVTCIVQHEAGHTERSAFTSNIDPKAFMNEQQKFGSALTFGKRYALCNGLGIMTGDEDDDSQSTTPDVKTKPLEVTDDLPWPSLAQDDRWKAQPAPDDDHWRTLGELSDEELMPIIKANVTNGGFNAAVSAACARLLSNTAKAKGYDKSIDAIKVSKFVGPSKITDYTASDLLAAYTAVLSIPHAK